MNEHLPDGPDHGDPSPDAAAPLAPDLIGLGLAEACETAAWAGVRVNVMSLTRPRPPWGIVVAQSPSPGTRLHERWRVHVLVSVPPAPAIEQDA